MTEQVKNFKLPAEAKSDYALVYIVQTPKETPRSWLLLIYLDGQTEPQHVGNTIDATYIYFFVKPGSHVVSVRRVDPHYGDGQNSASISVKGGDIVFLQLLYYKNNISSGPSIDLLNSSVEGKYYMQQYKPGYRTTLATENLPLSDVGNSTAKTSTPSPDGSVAYAEAKTANTLDAYEKFLKAYPSSGHRREAIEAMVGLLQKQNSTYADYRKFVSAYEDGLEFMPEKYRLALTGPDGMRVHDIVVLRKKGIDDNLIGAKIRSGKGRYKDFSFDEMDVLKHMGIPAVLIEAMIDSTTRAKREDENEQKKKELEDFQAFKQAEIQEQEDARRIKAEADEAEERRAEQERQRRRQERQDNVDLLNAISQSLQQGLQQNAGGSPTGSYAPASSTSGDASCSTDSLYLSWLRSCKSNPPAQAACYCAAAAAKKCAGTSWSTDYSSARQLGTRCW